MKKTLALALVVCAFLFLLAGCASQEIANDKMRIAVDWKKQGDMTMYRNLVNEAYQADPNNPFALNDMGTIAESEGRYKDAEGFYNKALANAGDKRVSVSDVKADQGMLLKDLVAQNLKNIQGKMK